MKQSVAVILALCLVIAAAVLIIGRDRRSSLPEENDYSFTSPDDYSEEDDGSGSEDVGSPYKHYMSQLNKAEAKAYRAIVAEICFMPESIRVPKLSSEELDNVFNAVTDDNPQFFFLGRKCSLKTIGSLAYFTPEYTMSVGEYNLMSEELDSKINDIISQIPAGSDRWHTEIFLHDWLVNNCTYSLNDSGDTSTPYSAIVKGLASCEGYSKAMKLLLDKVGIESALISGMGTNESGETDGHMWNIVKLGGDYCHLDVTWDDPDGSSNGCYAYFNVTDEEINANHFDWSFTYPCSSTTHSYYAVRGLRFDSFSADMLPELAKKFAAELETGNNTFELHFTTEKAYDSAIEQLIENKSIYDLLQLTAEQTVVSFDKRSISYVKDDARRVLKLIPDYM